MRTFHDLPKFKPLFWNKNVRYASELETLMAIESSGDLNPIQRTRLAELRAQGSYGNPEGIESTGNYGGGIPGGGQLDPSSQLIFDTINKQNEVFIAKIKEFDANNPFKYDDILAEEIAKVGTRLDPYYKQTLDDYLTAVNRKRTRSVEDERKTLQEISMDLSDYQKDNKVALEDALDKSREGYADAGLYSSGSRMRSEGKLGFESQNRLEDYQLGQERREADIKLTTQREQQDYNTEQSLFQRDVGSYDPTGIFKRGARSEAETKLQAIPEVQRRQRERDFARSQYAIPAAVDQAQYLLNSYNLLR